MRVSVCLIPVIAFALISSGARGAAEPGKPAPAFEAQDMTGKTHRLSDYAGQWLVLEWFNKDCPYVKKHYGSGNMQKLQSEAVAKKVRWLTVVSSAKGLQGYMEPAEAIRVAKDNGTKSTAVLLDPTGTIGRAYGAKTTPHMFVIDPKGTVVYAGAIDDNDSSDPGVIPQSKNHVSATLDSVLATPPRKVSTPATRPYGCGVKYGS